MLMRSLSFSFWFSKQFLPQEPGQGLSSDAPRPHGGDENINSGSPECKKEQLNEHLAANWLSKALRSMKDLAATCSVTRVLSERGQNKGQHWGCPVPGPKGNALCSYGHRCSRNRTDMSGNNTVTLDT